MPIPHQDWHLKTWRIQWISSHTHPDADNSDEVLFTPATAGVFQISSINCLHETLHGRIWNGVTCTGDPSNPYIARGTTNAVPGLVNISSKPFLITSSKPENSEQLTGEILNKGPNLGACWTAEE